MNTRTERFNEALRESLLLYGVLTSGSMLQQIDTIYGYSALGGLCCMYAT